MEKTYEWAQRAIAKAETELGDMTDEQRRNLLLSNFSTIRPEDRRMVFGWVQQLREEEPPVWVFEWRVFREADFHKQEIRGFKSVKDASGVWRDTHGIDWDQLEVYTFYRKDRMTRHHSMPIWNDLSITDQNRFMEALFGPLARDYQRRWAKKAWTIAVAMVPSYMKK